MDPALQLPAQCAAVGQLRFPERHRRALIGLETLVVAGLNAVGLFAHELSLLPGEYRCNAPTLVA